MEFKVGDRVEAASPAPGSGSFWRPGVIRGIVQNRGLFRVAIDGALLNGVQAVLTYSADELRHLPKTHTRGTHPISLANLAPGQAPREDGWEEKRLRLSAGACDWLRKQGRGNMSRAVEKLIMREIEREDKES
jgi:hypothetical protein